MKNNSKRLILIVLFYLQAGCNMPERSKQLPVNLSARQQAPLVTGRIGNDIDKPQTGVNWLPQAAMKIAGAASVSFDPENDTIYLFGRDTLYARSISSGKLTASAYSTGAHPARAGNQSLYINNWRNSAKVLNYSLGRQAVALFDLHELSWGSRFTYPDTATDYWQTNKFYSPADTAVYVIGGYGHYSYSNEVLRYSLNLQRWQKMNVGGDFFRPRYLSALGATGRGAYILGGYGSAQGKQLLGARNFYDMMFYNVEAQSFQKLYELDFDKAVTFANSMIVDEKNNLFYALAFENHKYNSSLRLIEGTLRKPAFRWVGDDIPYLFNDAASFTDLFYSPKSKKLIAVTMLVQGDNTGVKLYTLKPPPRLLPLTGKPNAQPVTKVMGKVITIALFIIIAIIFLLFGFIKKPAVNQSSVHKKTDAG